MSSSGSPGRGVDVADEPGLDIGGDLPRRPVGAAVEKPIPRRAPAIQDFDGFLKVLRADLKASEFVLLLLYERGKPGAALDEISRWVHPRMRTNLKRTLDRLTNDSAYTHFDGSRYFITGTGVSEVERRRLHEVMR